MNVIVRVQAPASDQVQEKSGVKAFETQVRYPLLIYFGHNNWSPLPDKNPGELLIDVFPFYEKV